MLLHAIDGLGAAPVGASAAAAFCIEDVDVGVVGGRVCGWRCTRGGIAIRRRHSAVGIRAGCICLFVGRVSDRQQANGDGAARSRCRPMTTTIDPGVAACVLVVTMAVYKGVELYTANCKIEQTVLRAEKAFPGFKAHRLEANDGFVSPVEEDKVAVELHLRLLKYLDIEYGVYALGLLLCLFGVAGFGIMLLQKGAWTTTLVVAACTMVMSLFGALVNLEIEIIRLRLDIVTSQAPSGAKE